MMILTRNKRFLLIFSLAVIFVSTVCGMDPRSSLPGSSSGSKSRTVDTILAKPASQAGPIKQQASSSSVDIENNTATQDKSYFTYFKEKLTNAGKNLPSYKTLKKLTASMAVISVSKFANDTIHSYFGDSLSVYAISAGAHLFLLIFIQMYEAWQNGELSNMKNLKKLLPVDVLTKSYWEEHKLLMLIQYGCTAMSCIAPYFGLSQTYPVGLSLFIQALLYDNEVKESLVANLYGILSSSSTKVAQMGIASLPEEVKDALISVPKDKAYDFLRDFYNLLKSLR